MKRILTGDNEEKKHTKIGIISNMQNLTVDQIKQLAIPVLKAAGIKRSALFGSYVRGEQHVKSDIDLLVEYPENTTLFDVADLKQNLEAKLGKPVDLVGYKSIKPRLKQQILLEQLPIL